MFCYQPLIPYLIENYPDMGQHHDALEKIGICRRMLARQEG